MHLETKRLILREILQSDFADLYEILSDRETMRYYPEPFDENRVRGWMERSIESYALHTFGLWAVVLKENGKVIGDCGITMQNIGGKIKPEIGYHINKKYQDLGYASEAAAGCRDWFFENTGYNAVYSYMKYTNVASYTVANKIGMRLVDEFKDAVNTLTRVYCITRADWEHQFKK